MRFVSERPATSAQIEMVRLVGFWSASRISRSMKKVSSVYDSDRTLRRQNTGASASVTVATSAGMIAAGEARWSMGGDSSLRSE